MGVTLKDIAEMAGVHKSTVDKVIHNRPGVSDKKREEIKKLLEETGYESNPLAKALNYQKKKLKVAAVLLKVDAQEDIKKGIEIVRQDFNSFNIDVSYFETEATDAGKQAEIIHRLKEEKVSGIVLQPIESPVVLEAAKALKEANIPFVTVNTDMKESGRLCFVGQNTNQSARMMAKMISLFLPQGGSVGIVSSDSMKVLQNRERIFREYMPKAAGNIELKDTLMIREIKEDAYRAGIDIVEKYPDLNGLFITTGMVTDICRAIRDKGRAGEMVVVCYERYAGIEELIKNGEVACSVSGSPSTQGRVAMRILFEYMIYAKEPERDILYTTNEIFIRENVMDWE